MPLIPEFEYPQVPACQDNFRRQFFDWYESIADTEPHRGSPRRSSTLRRLWKLKSGLLPKIECWALMIQTKEHRYKRLWHVLDTNIREFLAVDIRSFQGSEEDALTILEQRLQSKMPEEIWNQGDVMYQKFIDIWRAKWQKRLRGFIRLAILFREARVRANERLYRPGGKGYLACKARFNTLQEEPTPAKVSEVIKNQKGLNLAQEVPLPHAYKIYTAMHMTNLRLLDPWIDRRLEYVKV